MPSCTLLTEISENCHRNDEALNNLFNVAQGNTVAIDMSGDDGMHGIYASAYERVTDFFSSMVRQYGLYSLCVFIEDTNKPGQQYKGKKHEIGFALTS